MINLGHGAKCASSNRWNDQKSAVLGQQQASNYLSKTDQKWRKVSKFLLNFWRRNPLFGSGHFSTQFLSKDPFQRFKKLW